MPLVQVTCEQCQRKFYTNLAITKCPNCALGRPPRPITERVTSKPKWIDLVSYFRLPEDKGVGDTVQRYAAMLGGEQFKAWAKKLGMPCGCTTRQAEWNARYPYTEPHDQQQSSTH